VCGRLDDIVRRPRAVVRVIDEQLHLCTRARGNMHTTSHCMSLESLQGVLSLLRRRFLESVYRDPGALLTIEVRLACAGTGPRHWVNPGGENRNFQCALVLIVCNAMQQR
jgi:hypothetical protein